MVQAKRKGTRVERELTKLLQESGLKASRVPGSGAFMGMPGDINLTIGENRYRVEVKARANGEGFQTLERWKRDNDFLFLKRDRTEPMVCMDFNLFLDIALNAQNYTESIGKDDLGATLPEE